MESLISFLETQLGTYGAPIALIGGGVLVLLLLALVSSTYHATNY